jgi:hypothetical protein
LENEINNGVILFLIYLRVNRCVIKNDDMLYYKIKEILIRVSSLDSGEAQRVISIIAGGVYTIEYVSRCL